MEHEPTPEELDTRLAAALCAISDLLDDCHRDLALMRETLERIADIAREAVSS